MQVHRVALALIITATLAACGGAQARLAKHMQKGRDYLDSGNVEKARVEFQNALQIQPLNADARFENGLVLDRLGKPREAAQYYQSALEVNSDLLRARVNLARIYLLGNALDRAAETLAPAAEKHPDDPEMLAVRAAIESRRGQLDVAVPDAERAVQLAPENEDAVAVLAGIYRSEKADDKSRALLEKSIAGLPKTVALRLALAQLDVDDGNLEDAEAQLIKLVALEPKERGHRARLAQFYQRNKKTDAAEATLRDAVKALPQDYELKMALVQFLAAQRNADVAERELKAMISADPKDQQLKFALGRFYEDQHKWAEAEQVYRGLVTDYKLEGPGLAARDRLAALRIEQRDVDGALKLISEVLDKSPRDNEALMLRADIELNRQDPRAAIADLRAVLRDQPNSVPVLRILARAHMANGEPAVAEETLRHAVENAPTNDDLRFDFAQMLVNEGKPEQAKPLLAQLIAKQPRNLALLNVQFKAALGTGDFATASSDAADVVALTPKSGVGYYYQGLIAEAQKRYDDALKGYGAAVDAEPNSIEPLQAQLRLLVSLKRTNDAYRRADEITQRYPENALGPEAKAEILLSNGRRDESQAAFQMAASRAPAWWAPYRGLAAVKVEQGNLEAATQILVDAEGKVGQRDLLDLELAALYERRGKSDEAIATYNAVLQRDPQSEIANNNLAMLLATTRSDAASLDRAKLLAARFSESPNPSYLDTYGWVLYKRGEVAASVPVLERAVAKTPSAPVPLYHLGMAQVRIGSADQARQNLSRAVQSGKNFPGLQEAKATLDRIAKTAQTATTTG